MVISLVGLSASGKSYISELLCQYSDRIVKLDVDKVGHEATNDEDIKRQLVLAFGSSIIDSENKIIRPNLSAIVFNSEDAMNTLTDITWGYMERVITEFIAKNKDKIVVLDWLLLPKTKFFMESDLRILVTAPLDVRMERAMKRDGITREKFLNREANAPLIVPEQFDYIINNVEVEKTKEEVGKIYEKSIVHR